MLALHQLLVFAPIAARTSERLRVKAMGAVSRTTRILSRSASKLAIKTRCLGLGFRRDQASHFADQFRRL